MSHPELQATLKVKDNKAIGALVIFFSASPLFILAATGILLDSYQFAFLIIGLIWIGLAIWFVWNARKNEDDYDIVADNETVTFKKQGTFRWSEITSIRTYTKFNWPISNHPDDYLELGLVNGSGFIIKTTTYDLTLKDLESSLKIISGKN